MLRMFLGKSDSGSRVSGLGFRVLGSDMALTSSSFEVSRTTHWPPVFRKDRNPKP